MITAAPTKATHFHFDLYSISETGCCVSTLQTSSYGWVLLLMLHLRNNNLNFVSIFMVFSKRITVKYEITFDSITCIAIMCSIV